MLNIALEGLGIILHFLVDVFLFLAKGGIFLGALLLKLSWKFIKCAWNFFFSEDKKYYNPKKYAVQSKK